MSCAAICVVGGRGPRRKSLSGRAAPREIRISLCAAGGVVVALLVYVVLLSVSARSGFFTEDEWVSSSAGRLRPYGAAVAEWGAVFAHAAAQALTWIAALIPVPLAVASLLWLSRRDQRLYVRLATALLLSGAVGLGATAMVRGWPVHETSLIRDYLTLPGAQAGWYVQMAFAVVAATTKTWPRIGVTFIALFAVVAALCTTEHPMLDLLPAAVGPLLAWYATGRLPGRGERQSRAAGDAFPVVPQVGIASERVPLRQTG